MAKLEIAMIIISFLCLVFSFGTSLENVSKSEFITFTIIQFFTRLLFCLMIVLPFYFRYWKKM